MVSEKRRFDDFLPHPRSPKPDRGLCNTTEGGHSRSPKSDHGFGNGIVRGRETHHKAHSSATVLVKFLFHSFCKLIVFQRSSIVNMSRSWNFKRRDVASAGDTFLTAFRRGLGKHAAIKRNFRLCYFCAPGAWGGSFHIGRRTPLRTRRTPLRTRRCAAVGR